MENCTSDGAVTRPESMRPQDSERSPEGPEQQPKPVLSLVSHSSGEDGFLARGAAEDKSAMEKYAAMIPRAHILGRVTPRHLLMAGGVGLLLMGALLGRHLPTSKAVPAIPEKAVPAPANVATPAPGTPAIPAAPVAAVLAPAPTQPVVPLPTPARASNLAAVAAPVPVAPAQDPADKPAPEPEQGAQPVRTAEPQNLQGCREAIKRRDVKLVNANCEGALAADASLAKPLLAFAKIQFERGKSAQAAVWARKIVQVNDSLADAYLILGAAEQEARHPAAAKTAYQRYLELAPKGPYAEDVRSSLKSL